VRPTSRPSRASSAGDGLFSATACVARVVLGRSSSGSTSTSTFGRLPSFGGGTGATGGSQRDGAGRAGPLGWLAGALADARLAAAHLLARREEVAREVVVHLARVLVAAIAIAVERLEDDRLELGPDFRVEPRRRRDQPRLHALERLEIVLRLEETRRRDELVD